MHESKEKLIRSFIFQLHCHVPLHPASDDYYGLVPLLEVLFLVVIYTYVYQHNQVLCSPHHMFGAMEPIASSLSLCKHT